MRFPWTTHRLNVTRALKEQAVHSRNEVARTVLILDAAAGGSGLPAKMCAVERDNLIRANQTLMDRVADAQGWLRKKKAVKAS